PRLIPGQGLGWRLLLKGLILPLRVPKVSVAYAEIAGEGLLPLAEHSARLAEEVGKVLPAYWRVEHAFVHGTPSLPEALLRLKEAGCESIRVLPLFPQFAEATTLSARDALQRGLDQVPGAWRIEEIEHFYA
ncbi:MAG: ferrochelatase, partial [Planctomycetes bacterium]|nr:ferrochelatase [Planctomycetota bacterium]